MELKRQISEFFFEPASPFPLAVLRILVAAVLLIQAVLIAPDIFDLYGSQGIFQKGLTEYFANDTLPGVSSFLRWTAYLGVPERASLLGLSLAYLFSLSFLLLGFCTRPAAIAAWFTHLLTAGAHFSSYGVDQFAHVFLFYFIWMPVGHALSLDLRLSRVRGGPSESARFSLRMIQLQLCIVYFASGVEKALGEQWWNGEAIWRSLMLPEYYQYDLSWLSRFPILAKLGSWGTLLVEIGYPIFVWPSRTRRLWVVATIGLHVGIGVFLGLGTFAAFMSVLTLCTFGLSAETDKSLEFRPRS